MKLKITKKLSNHLLSLILEHINPSYTQIIISLKLDSNTYLCLLPELLRSRHTIDTKKRIEQWLKSETQLDTNFEGRTKEMIRKSLNRFTQTINIDYAVKGNTDDDLKIINDPPLVLEEIKDTSKQLFQSRENKNAPIPDKWKHDFETLIAEPELMRQIAKPPTTEEITHWISILGQDKAPGPSNFTIRHLL
jgi:hypothetical protein